MNHYSYTRRLKEIWQSAVAKYRDGNRQPETYYNPEELAFLNSIGLKEMDVYDFAEDYVQGGEPDFESFLTVSEARRDYFVLIQNGQSSSELLDPASLPAKSESVRGIVWLPRILPKALAKLRGELPPETMYGCGGDRKFFKENNIHPAEFLRISWAYEHDPEKVIDWVETRRKSKDG